MNCNVQPLNGYVLALCKRSEMHGSIILSEGAKEKPRVGEIIAIAEPTPDKDGKLEKYQVGVGDTVYFTKWAATELDSGCKVTVDGQAIDPKDLMLVKYSELMLFVKKG